MTTGPRIPRALHRLRLLALPAITVTLGLQLLRVLFPSLVWYLREVQGFSSASLGLLAALVPLGSLLAVTLWRLVGQRWTVSLILVLLLLARLTEQLSVLPEVDLWLSLAGGLLFAAFLPAWLGHLRSSPGLDPGPRGPAGILVGLALDSALKGINHTLDLSWSPGPFSLATVAALSLVILLLLRWEVFPLGRRPSDPLGPNALLLAGLGPFLFLQAVVFQNSGWIAAVSGTSARLAFPLVMLGNAALAAGLLWGYSRPSSLRPLLGLLAAAYLLATSRYLETYGPGLLPILLVAQFVMGWGWAGIGTASSRGQRSGIRRLGLSLALGFLLFVALTFYYYAGLDLRLPLERSLVLPLASGLLALAFLLASFHGGRVARIPQVDRIPLQVVLGLAVTASLAFAVMATVRPPLVAATSQPTVMTYNIHSAYDLAGRQDPEAIARVIEQSGADIVVLQEASRGWLINGSTDLVYWLSHRLRMAPRFRGTSDPVWGNAILSRVPIRRWGHGSLPAGVSLIQRGYLWADFEWAHSGNLRVLATHLHQIEADHALRRLQAEALLGVWDGAPQSVVAGDLNAIPGELAIHQLEKAGLIDSWPQQEDMAGFTYPADRPIRRIDWIFHTEDLVPASPDVIDSQASDHRPLQVQLSPAN